MQNRWNINGFPYKHDKDCLVTIWDFRYTVACQHHVDTDNFADRKPHILFCCNRQFRVIFIKNSPLSIYSLFHSSYMAIDLSPKDRYRTCWRTFWSWRHNWMTRQIDTKVWRHNRTTSKGLHGESHVLNTAKG